MVEGVFSEIRLSLLPPKTCLLYGSQLTYLPET